MTEHWQQETGNRKNLQAATSSTRNPQLFKTSSEKNLHLLKFFATRRIFRRL